MFERRTVVKAPIDVVFDLSLSIDAHVESMSASGERAVAGVTVGIIGLGEQVTWRARHFGIPFRMTSKIVELDRPSYFVDEQVSGPFHKFRHEHHFEMDDGETTMIDRVSFTAPFGVLGRIAERIVLASYLPKLIEDRNRFLKTAAER